MKKIIIFLCILTLSISVIFAEEFNLPKIENNKDSIAKGYNEFLTAITLIGYIEYGSGWTSSEASIIARHIEHLDSVLKNMTYSKSKEYINQLNIAINAINYQELSKSQIEKFHTFLANPYYQDKRFIKKEQQEAWEKIRGFKTWVAFFKNEHKDPLLFFEANHTKEYLYKMVDKELPQKLSAQYKNKLDTFFYEWENGK